jgi:hypothetical protein
MDIKVRENMEMDTYAYEIMLNKFKYNILSLARLKLRPKN